MTGPLTALALWLAQPALADPCGLVPPLKLVSQSRDMPIERTGVQRTWVMHHDGMETLAIRPAFTGKADEFGMLIPLPAPPSLHKIPDETFQHLENMLDLPPVHISLWGYTRDFLSRLPMGRSYQSAIGLSVGVTGRGGNKSIGGGAPHENTLIVHQEQAIGAYEVAILEAGSTKALERWMKLNGYTYPGQMDEVVTDYVAQGWVFAAVKARLGKAGEAAPHPGQRKVQRTVAADADFQGFVQGMAFRFPAEEPVVPMRLSTFNGSDLHNRVFILTDQPVRFAELSTALVKRQVPGKELIAALEGPLQLQWLTGQEHSDHLTDTQWNEIEGLRDPAPYTWAARSRIAADLTASQTHTLSLEQEDWHRDLVNISAALGLKGPTTDRLELELVAQRFEETDALAGLADMTLTVLDGPFHKATLRQDNLHPISWNMADQRNRGLPWTGGSMQPIQRQYAVFLPDVAGSD